MVSVWWLMHWAQEGVYYPSPDSWEDTGQVPVLTLCVPEQRVRQSSNSPCYSLCRRYTAFHRFHWTYIRSSFDTGRMGRGWNMFLQMPERVFNHLRFNWYVWNGENRWVSTLNKADSTSDTTSLWYAPNMRVVAKWKHILSRSSMLTHIS